MSTILGNCKQEVKERAHLQGIEEGKQLLSAIEFLSAANNGLASLQVAEWQALISF